MWTFSEVIDGIAEACATFGTPITGGNVSFYNETLGTQIMPTPVIGMLGVIDDAERRMDIAFKEPGHAVLLLGETLEELGGTEYLELVHGLKQGPIPRLDLRREADLQGAVRELIAAELLASCHDVSDGGLAMALADCCFASLDPTMAVEVTLAQDLREDAILFGESQSRAVVPASRRTSTGSWPSPRAGPCRAPSSAGCPAIVPDPPQRAHPGDRRRHQPARHLVHQPGDDPALTLRAGGCPGAAAGRRERIAWPAAFPYNNRP